MWVHVAVPSFAPGATAQVIAFHGRRSERLAAGAALVDLRVDLSGGVLRDCPPVTTYRILLSEPLWLRSLAEPGLPLRGGALLAELSDEADEPRGATRAARISVAAILHHDDWWDDPA